MKIPFLFFLLFLSVSFYSFGQGATCASAENLVINGACDTSASSLDATNEQGFASCMGNFVNEGWWVFSSATLMDITIDATNGTGNRRLSLSVYSGTCGGTLTEIGCVNDNGNGLDESLTLNALSSGTYYVRVYFANGNASNSVSSICVSGTIPCNEPNVTAATSITSTTAIINWTAATPVPSNGYDYIVSTDNSTATPGDDTTGSTTGTSVNVTGLTASTLYYVFVRSNCGGVNSGWNGPITFTTAAPGPSNDEPCGAIPLTTGTSCSTTTGTTVNATYTTGIPNPGCGFYQNTEPDVWYTAQVAANGTLQIDALITGTMPDPVIAIYSAASCAGPFTLIECDDDGGPGAFLESRITLTGQTPGETLYIRVWEYQGNDNGTFGICATEDDPYCDAESTSSTDYIEDFSTTGGTTNISNLNSGFSTGGWGDFTSQVVTQYQSGVVDFIVDFSFDTATYGFNIWVDFNDDLDFNDAGENVYSSNGFITGVASSFTIPVNAPVGSHRMRIRSNFLSSNPSACGTISFGEAEDYTLTVTPILCSDNPSNIQISSITTNSATISWDAASPAPGNGYAYYITTNPAGPNFNDTPTGTTTGTSANVTGLSDGTTYYVFVRSDCGGGNGLGAWQGPETFDTELAPPVTTDTEICQGNTGYLFASAACSGGVSLGNTIPGELDAANDPVDFRPCIFIVSTDPCCFSTSSTNWTSIDFEVTVTGTYVFSMDPSVTFDAMGYIVEGAFTPGVCGSGTWIAGDDDSGPALDPQITANLVAGVTYTLYTMPFGSGTTTASFQWNVSGPGTINESTPNGGLDWYTAASGGTLLGSGSPFNPVGVAGSPLADTNTAGTWTFYAECSENPGVRTPAQFTITQGPEVTVSGAEGPGCDEYTITFDLVGTAPWGIKYSDGSSSTTVGGINTSPFQLVVNSSTVTAGTVYTASQVFDSSGCNGLPSGISGSATVSYAGCGCTIWDGSAGDDNWNTAANWSTNMVPTLSDCVIIPDTGGSDPIILDGIDALALSVTINSGAGITVQSLGTITVQEQVDNAGYFVLESNVVAGNQQDTGQLVQIDDTFSNTGSITMVRETNVRTQDYVYWSSPVENFSITNIGYSNRYYWIPTIDANLGDAGNWQATSETMVAGKGYIVRAPFSSEPGNNPDTPTWNTQVFTGVPNNGIIVRNEIERGANYSNINQTGGLDTIEEEDDNWNLVGNPYPSALSIDDFLAANSNLDSYVKLWRHGTKIGQGYGSPFYGNYTYNYNLADYLTYNALGGTQSGFEGYIGAGQGFFVQLLDGASSPFTPTSVTFNNSMRSSGYNNGQFFRTSNDASSERHRIWLDLVDPSGVAYSSLIGYMNGATMEIDPLFDAPITDTFSTNLYSMSDGESMIIQGRSLPFDINDQVPLGFTVSETGIFTLAIQDIDGLFGDPSQDIFVSDLDTGMIHNLKEAPYIFSVDESGTFNNRLVLIYTNTTLSMDDVIKNDIRIMAPNNEYIKVTSGTHQIQEIKVYDLVGRMLINKQNINTTEYTINNVPQASGAYIVKVFLANGIEKIQKVVLK